MRPKPYIGVTGVTSAAQSEALLNAIPQESAHNVMIGVLVSSKTLTGTKNRWPNRYPPPETLPHIMLSHPKAMNILHFNTKNEGIRDILDDLEFAQELAGKNCHGFQLNIAWPDPALLELYKATQFPSKIVVLQCGSQALEAVGMSGRAMADKVTEYRGLVDYVLVDPSGGEGKEFDLALAYECFAYLEDVPGIGYGIAGGLEASNVWRLKSLLTWFPSFSVDVEGRVRDADDNLNVEAACEYLRAANHLFGHYVVPA